MTLYNTLKQLCLCPSVSGREKKIRNLISEMVAPFCDEVKTDNLGNLIGIKRGSENGKNIMLAAHMDEIGFLVTFIEDSGIARIAPVGGISFSAAAYARVVSENGVRGVIVPDSKTKPEDYKADNFYIDIGARNKKAAEQKIAIGDFFVLTPSLERLMGQRVCGRPLDDRVGCLVLLGIAEALAEVKTENNIYYVFSTQEEVGCRGAMPASFAIRPDFGLCFDVTGTGDVPSASPMRQTAP